MKNIMKTLVILLALVLSACNEEVFSGTITAKQTLQLVDKDKKPVSIAAGLTNAQFKAAKKDRLDIILNQNGKKQTVPVKVNFSLKDIKSGDRIYVTPQTSGQLYTLSGDYQVNTTSSDYNTYTESCSYEYNQHQVCSWETIPGYCETEDIPRHCDYVTECNPKDPSQCATREYNCTGGGTREYCHPSRTEQQCHTESDTYYGQHEVTSYGTTTTKYYTLDILDNSSQNVGRIKFGTQDSDRHVTNETPCR